MKILKRGLAAFAAVLLVAGGLLVGVGSAPAEAHTASASVTCSTWEVSASSYDQGAIGTVIVDGVTEFGPAAIQGGGFRSGVFENTQVNHRLQVTIDSQDGDQYDFTYDVTTTGCEPIVEPPVDEPDPVVVPQIQDYVGECDAAFVLDNTGSTLPVTYMINGIRYLVEAGTAVHTDADGTRIDPLADGTYVITTDTGRTWTFQGNVCVDTPPIEPPVVTDPPVDPPVEPPVVIDTPVVTEPPTELIPPVSGEVVYENCQAVLDAGVTLVVGDAGYSVDLDGDANGIACDSYVAPEPTEPAAAGDAGPADTLPQTGSEINWAAIGLFVAVIGLLALIGFAMDRTKRNGPRL